MIAVRTIRRISATVKLSGQHLRLKDRVRVLNFARAMSTTNPLNLSGVFPPIATPFDKNEDISWEKLEHNMNRWNQCDFKGIVRALSSEVKSWCHKHHPEGTPLARGLSDKLGH